MKSLIPWISLCTFALMDDGRQVKPVFTPGNASVDLVAMSAFGAVWVIIIEL